MSGTVGVYLRAMLLRQVFHALPAPPLEVVYVALTRNLAPENATGEQLEEPEGGSYGRAVYPVGQEHWALAGYAQMRTTRDVVFPTATGDWGLVSGWALTSEPTSGAVLASGRLVTPDTVVEGATPAVYAGGITIQLDD